MAMCIVPSDMSLRWKGHEVADAEQRIRVSLEMLSDGVWAETGAAREMSDGNLAAHYEVR